ncbi:Gfo/Idh/MocA family oxidoreductase [Pannus brasiliensis CCIBt3594]|uniref:Gfo/Idh/MocA family oxidoreductase n=1 Tax=Pannus brasiliensis CCIBt3594 TaxID=1427578 RepID=A0AAW9QYG1_9CHRO
MQTGIAVLGVGRWGVHFARHFSSHPAARLVAVVDPSREKLDSCRDKFGLDDRSIEFTTDWNSLRDRPDIDAVVIVTPAITHYSLITEALDRGYHVLAEKPLTLDPRECEELTRQARERGRILFVDHTYLFHEAVREGRNVLQSGSIGQPRYGYATRSHLGPVRQDVSALWDLAIHDIAIFNHWLDSRPVRVQARGITWLQPNIADLVQATLIYPDGFEAYIHLCWLNPDKQRRLAIAGTTGTLIFDELSPEAPLTLQKGTFDRQGDYFLPIDQKTEIIPVTKGEPLREVCDRFLHSIATNTEFPPANGTTATELVKVLHALDRSLALQGETITVE